MTTASPAPMDDAIARYESYIAADPGNPLLWTSLGDLYHQAGRFEEATACYEKTLLNDAGNAIATGRLAGVLISQQRFAEAEKLLASLIAAGEQDAALFHNLGLALYYQKRWTAALTAFRQARDKGLDDPENLAYLTYSLHHLGDTEHALEFAREWVKRAPTDAAEGYLAVLEMDHGDMAAAQRRAEAVLHREPHNTDAAVVVGTGMVERQEIDRAVRYFSQVTDAEPENPRGWLGLGLTYLYQQRHQQAIQTLEKARRFMPDNAGTIVTLGWARLASQDAVGAEGTFREAIAVNRNFGEAHGGLATALVFQNRQDEAREEVKLALRLDPKNFGAVFANSVLLRLQGKEGQATRMLGRLFEQSPREGGPPLIESIQLFMRQQGVQGPSEKKGSAAPGGDK